MTTALVANDYYEATVVQGGAVSKELQIQLDEAPMYIGSQILGATVAGAINYALFSAGIAASEAAAAITRGSAASTASFAGAFGMVPNTALVGPVGGGADGGGSAAVGSTGTIGVRRRPRLRCCCCLGDGRRGERP